MIDILKMFQLTQRILVPTHGNNGYLDVIITDEEHTPVSVSVEDFGLSDHFFMTWCTNFSPPIPTYVTVSRHKWKNFNNNGFVTQLQESELDHTAPPAANVDHLANWCNAVITELLNKLAPLTDMRIQERLRKPWFATKRHAWSLEWKYKSCKKAWRISLKHSRRLTSGKASSYWKSEKLRFG